METKQKVGKFVFWAPRVLSIAFIAFLAMFSLDIFGNNYSFWEVVLGLLMHNIPTFILIAILWISWRHEIVGAVSFVVAGLLYIILIATRSIGGQAFEWYMLSWSLIIAGPAFFIGILFWIGWKRKRVLD